MAYHHTTLSQILKMVPRLEFEKLGNQHDGRRRSDALSRWSQFVALSVGQLAGRTSLRDIEVNSPQPIETSLSSGLTIRKSISARSRQRDAGLRILYILI